MVAFGRWKGWNAARPIRKDFSRWFKFFLLLLPTLLNTILNGDVYCFRFLTCKKQLNVMHLTEKLLFQSFFYVFNLSLNLKRLSWKSLGYQMQLARYTLTHNVPTYMFTLLGILDYCTLAVLVSRQSTRVTAKVHALTEIR